ncbi:unnamed protein product, partial [Brassica rapa]
NTEKTSLNLAPQGTSLMRQLSHSSSSLPLSRGYLCNNNKAESSSSIILLLFDQSRFCSNPPTASSQSGTGFITVALDVEIVPPENSVLNAAAERFFKSEIRRRLFVTSVLLVLSRVGYFIPLHGFDRRLIPQDYLSFVSGSVGECSHVLYSRLLG